MKKLLVIGAGFLQSFVIQKAKRMGYTVYAVDADKNAVGFKYADYYRTINIVDEKACLEYAKENNIDGVLTAATDFGVLTTAYIAQEMNLVGLKYDVAQLIKNKYKVRKCLFINKVDDTEQAYEVDENTNIELLSQKLTYPVMVKPCDGSGSRGACRVDCFSALKVACIEAMRSSITSRAVIESFIVGREYGVESLVVNGNVNILGVMEKWMTNPPYYAELGHAIPTDLPWKVENRAKQCVKDAIKALGINSGSVNMDLIITEEGKIHIVDIGARMGGNMIGTCIIPYGTGIDYMAAMVQNAVGDEVCLERGEKNSVATKLLAFKGGRVKRLPDVERIEEKYDVEIYHHLEKGMIVNEYHTNLDGCGYIVARGKNQDEAIKKAEKTLEYFEKTIFEDNSRRENNCF